MKVGKCLYIRRIDGIVGENQMTNVNREHFVRVWNEEVDQLGRLNWSLPNKADREEVRNIQKRLKELVEKASLEIEP